MRRSQATPAEAHHHAGKAPRPPLFGGEGGDVDIALLEDAVFGQKAFQVVDRLQERIEEVPDVVQQLLRQVLVDAADAEIGGVQARAASTLVERHHLLAVLEPPQRWRQRADVHRLGGDVEDMGEEPAHLGIEHADKLAADRHGDAEQLFGGQAEGVLLVHRRDVVEPVEIGHGLMVGLVLDQLFGAAVQQAHMRIGAGDDLAVELQHQAQDAVGRRMLRAEIDIEVADLCLSHARRLRSNATIRARQFGSATAEKPSPWPSPCTGLPHADTASSLVFLRFLVAGQYGRIALPR